MKYVVLSALFGSLVGSVLAVVTSIVAIRELAVDEPEWELPIPDISPYIPAVPSHSLHLVQPPELIA